MFVYVQCVHCLQYSHAQDMGVHAAGSQSVLDLINQDEIKTSQERKQSAKYQAIDMLFSLKKS